jgi:acid phosphatase (class A)
MTFLRVFIAAVLVLSAFPAASGGTAVPFIDAGAINVASVLPPPPQTASAEAKMDNSYIKYASAAATENQKLLGIAASHDGVFDYSLALGIWFNPKLLPKTAVLFRKVTSETIAAIEVAKNHFKRVRPETWKETGDPENSDGYCYPSGHTTRAYVWATLLANALPDEKDALHKEARKKAWYRVILGRHYPSDVRAGKTYGTYLAGQFLKSPEFQKKWAGVCEELRTVHAKAVPPPSFKP